MPQHADRAAPGAHARHTRSAHAFAIATIFVCLVFLSLGLSRAPKSAYDVATALAELRSNLLHVVTDPSTGDTQSPTGEADTPTAEARSLAGQTHDVTAEPLAYWMSGTGETLDMKMTATFRFDDSGRFVTAMRGPVSNAKGFDGQIAWEQDATGNTRTMTLGDAQRTMLLFWILGGYWVSADAPVTRVASERSVDDGEMALQVGLHDSRFVGDLLIDTKRWLPKAFFVTDIGQEFELRFDEFETHEGRALPKRVRLIVDGRVNSEIVFDTFRADGDFDAGVFAPWKSEVQVVYDAEGEGVVASMRGRWGHHFVEPTINGKKPGWIAFDTGARMSTIDDRVAQALGLEPIGTVESVGVGGKQDATLYRIESIEIGPVRLTNIPIAAGPMSSISLGLSGHIGILGMDVLWHCVIDYDQQNSRIALYDPRTYTLASGEWRALLDYNNKPTVTMLFEGHEGLFTIDTGNPGAIVISPLTVDRLMLLNGRSTRSGTVGGIGGRVSSRDGDLAWVEWGEDRFENVPANFVTENRGVAADLTRDGVIGTDLLRRYRIIFDMPHGRIAYLPLQSTPD